MSNTGLDQAREQAEKIRAEVESNKEMSMTEVKQELAQVKLNPALLAMYQENADLGTENINGSTPILKIHSTNKSTSNHLLDGSEPKDGSFFYPPTQEEFETVECHLLSVSRGYYALDLSKKKKYHQLLAGVIINNKSGMNKMEPFITYITGKKCSYFFDFAKKLSTYTKSRTFPIPMFALKVRLTTKKVPTESWGPVWIIEFEIVKDEAGQPVVVTDPEVFIFLRDLVEMVDTRMNSLIGTTEIEGTNDADEIKKASYPSQIPQYAQEP
uniref:hypothetical protein n=1 Tax=Polynucleobacter sp. TaxID=2029855 RepID=UPI003F697E02